jgi:hypothetical protein
LYIFNIIEYKISENAVTSILVLFAIENSTREIFC